MSLFFVLDKDKNSDPMMVLDKSKGIIKVVRIHPEGDMNVCTKYNVNQ